MTTNEIFMGARVAHVRELKAEVARLREELSRTRSELESLRNHFALALEAARDADSLPVGARLLVVDGWNAVLGSVSVIPPSERRGGSDELEEALCRRVRAWLAAHPSDAAWIVFDGSKAGGRAEPRLRISYTGGSGAHRADRMVCDYLRMRRLSGASHTVLVATQDKDFRREALSLGAEVINVDEICNCATEEM